MRLLERCLLEEKQLNTRVGSKVEQKQPQLPPPPQPLPQPPAAPPPGANGRGQGAVGGEDGQSGGIVAVAAEVDSSAKVHQTEWESARSAAAGPVQGAASSPPGGGTGEACAEGEGPSRKGGIELVQVEVIPTAQPLPDA